MSHLKILKYLRNYLVIKPKKHKTNKSTLFDLKSPCKGFNYVCHVWCNTKKFSTIFEFLLSDQVTFTNPPTFLILSPNIASVSERKKLLIFQRKKENQWNLVPKFSPESHNANTLFIMLVHQATPRARVHNLEETKY